jgi:hypothetical protein
MTDDLHAAVWYFGAFGVVLALGLVGYFCLRHPFAGFARTLLPGWTSGRLRRLLFTLIFFPIFAGVFSVSFYDCGHSDYEKIVKDRPYIQVQSRAEVTEGLHWMVSGVLVLAFVLGAARKR